jgi:dihydrofolate synthase/folylpolyglutamate synthase
MVAPPDTYRRTLERLYGLERGKSPLGLGGTRALLDDLGAPEREFRSVHVAGTNGKGSTSALLERCLRAAGLRTGLFTSPHLVDFRERLRVDGAAIRPEALEHALARVESAPAAAGRTFFEVTFALGALHFDAQGVECAVLETGLGGRLDSTNVVTPALSVLTRIGLDHMDLLGDTIEAIAGEKAGIVKRGVPAVSATQDARAWGVLERRAREVGSELVRAGRTVRVRQVHALEAQGSDVTLGVLGWGDVRVRIALAGRHQIENAVTAAAAFHALEPQRQTLSGDARPLAIDARTLAEGLAAARWPGRFEACPDEPRLWWDGAHNPEGARALRETWRDVMGDRPGVLVLGLSSDKDARAVLDVLAGPWRAVFGVAADSPRALDATAVVDRVRAAWPAVESYAAGTVADGVRRALGSLRAGEAALATGSLFVVGEAMAATGGGALECL